MFNALKHYDATHQILMGYMDYYYRFKLITKRARIRFEQRDWHGIQDDAKGRIDLYRDDVGETTHEVAKLLQDFPADAEFWAKVKAAFAEEIKHFNTRNIAETFYNSVYRHFHKVGANQALMFVARTGSYREYQGHATISYNYNLGTRDLNDILTEMLSEFLFDADWDNQKADIQLVASRWQHHIDLLGGRSPKDRLEILTSLFYRNKSAYIVGRFLKDDSVHPFILPLLHPNGRGVLIDALLLEADQVTSIFSYHRSYFLADITVPSDMVDFLKTFMPTKAISELYNAIGFEKHGKTVFYRELVRHFRLTSNKPHSQQSEAPEEQFITAAGIAGMVMYVFTMPKLNMVFKIIRDKFAPPKQVTPKIVKEKYELVKYHDRVGRMADSYLFEKLALPLDRFDPACLAELRETAATKVEVTEDAVLISHVYVEKKMTPLNIYLEEANEANAQKALRDYGRAIKQLAAANIFPGDLLLKTSVSHG